MALSHPVANLLDGNVVRTLGDEVQVQTEVGDMWVQAPARIDIGQQVTATIRPEYVKLSVEEPAGGRNLVKGTVRTRAFLGDSMEHVVRAGTIEIRVKEVHDDQGAGDRGGSRVGVHGSSAADAGATGL